MSEDRDALEARIRAACDAARWEAAATIALEGYGEELLSYLAALTRNATDADEVFAMACENIWTSLPKFRWQCTFRTYAYTLVRHAWVHFVRSPHRRAGRALPLSSPSVDAVAIKLRSHTATFLRTETKDKIAALRAQLDPDDQTLLILRINRQLPWRDIAQILSTEEDDVSTPALDKRAAALRKRFERLKLELRERMGGGGEGDA